MSWWYRRSGTPLSREMGSALLIGFMLGLVSALAGRGRWAPIFDNLWLAGMCMLGTVCLLLGLLVMRGVLSPGPWSGRSGGAQVCFGVGLLLNFLPKLVVPPALQAGGVQLVMRVMYWASCSLLAVGLCMSYRARSHAHPGKGPEANA